MRLSKKFFKQKSGIGIVEYVLLLALFGTMVVVVSPSLREAVGNMYDQQIHSTNELNGMVDSEKSNRIDLDNPGQIVNKSPNTNQENTGPNVITPDPIVVEKPLQSKVVSVAVKESDTADFEEEVVYDQDNYYGMLKKKPGGLSSEVVETKTITTTKDEARIVTRNSVEELEAVETIPVETADGYKGDLNPVGNIEVKFVEDPSSSGIVTKDSGTVYLTRETTSTDTTYINSLFPSEYLYEEIDSSSGAPNGYKGDVFKKGNYTRTTIGKESIIDEREAVQNRSGNVEIDRTESAQEIEYTVKSPATGTSATNPNSYPIQHNYNDGLKEGTLNYVGKYATLIDTKVETKPITTTQYFSTPTPPETYNYNTDGFTGSLVATGPATFLGGEQISYAQKTVTNQTSSYYSDGDGFYGYLNQYVYSGSYQAADSMYVSGQTSSYYNSNGYTGYLSQYVYSGSAGGSKYVSQVGVSRSGYCDTRNGANWQRCNEDQSHPSTISYSDAEGYKGTLGSPSYSYYQSPQYDSGNGHKRFDWSRTWTYSGTVTKTDTRVYRYQGTVSRPGYDTRVFRYQGTVTRPASDTRVWSRTYTGEVTRTTRTYEYTAKYAGTIMKLHTKEEINIPETINYTDPQGYTGVLNKKPETITTQYTGFRIEDVNKGTYEQKVYSDGLFTSSSNTKSYPSTYAYSDGFKTTGNLNYISRGSEFSHATQNSKIVDTYGEYATNSIPQTYAYNMNGFTGDLAKNGSPTLISGTYTPAQTKYVTGQASSNYNDAEGYRGILSAYLYSGSYTPSEQKYVTGYMQGTYTWGEVCMGGDGTTTFKTEASVKPSGTVYYNVNGYTGTLSLNTWSGVHPQNGNTCGASTRPTAKYLNHYDYRGYVTKPAVDTRVYRYEGNVTKSETDTRIWGQNYRGEVKDTLINYYKHFALYRGTIYKKSHIANYSYSLQYEGKIYKTTLVDKYRYQMPYSGMLAKGTYEFNYSYEREYRGTLFKTINEDILEYTQLYEGTVTERP